MDFFAASNYLDVPTNLYHQLTRRIAFFECIYETLGLSNEHRIHNLGSVGELQICRQTHLNERGQISVSASGWADFKVSPRSRSR